ncbi:hypothetical protein ACJX0J_011761, partial [Zea mays]
MEIIVLRIFLIKSDNTIVFFAFTSMSDHIYFVLMVKPKFTSTFLTLENYKHDIIIYKKDHGRQEISILHPALLKKGRKLDQPNPYLCYGRLSKQVIVDCRTLEDEDRLRFIAKNQNKLQIEYLQGLADAVEKRRMWLDKRNIDITIDIINRFISAEIPSSKEDPLGYAPNIAIKNVGTYNCNTKSDTFNFKGHL